MAIAKRTPLYLQCLLLAGSISLVACGGGGSSSPKDTTPNAITFTASTNVEPNAAVTSPAVTINGIDADASVSISGGEYSINGGAFTSASGKISNGQSLVVRVTASDKTNTAKSATITVGGVSATFSVTTLADVTPADFTLAPVTNAALGATVTSTTVTLSGFDIAVPVSITGGEYSINGSAFTSVAGTVSAAQSVAVKLVASDNHSTTTTAQLTVGGISAGFSVTTLPDSTPDEFSFTAKTGAAINTAYISDAVTVNGIDTVVAISITGGEYSVNGGVFTTATGTVVVNDTVTVKTTAANGTELTREAVLTIGGVVGTYAITTIDDEIAPVAEFKFPTPYTMSEANSVKVRGTATDEHVITSVKLLVGETEIEATPKSEANGVKDFSSWTATIPLTANAENEIKVIATDDRNNTTLVANANKVTVRQADVKSAFPSEDNQFDFISSNLLFDNYDGRNRILVIDDGTDQVVSVDLSTGLRTTLFDDDCSLTAWTIDPVSKHIFGMCDAGTGLKEYDLKTGQNVATYEVTAGNFSIVRAMTVDRNNGRAQIVMVGDANHETNWVVTGFSLANKSFFMISNDDQSPEIQTNYAVIVNKDEYLLPGGRFDSDAGGEIISVSPINGTRKIVSNNSIGTGDEYSGYLNEIRTASLSGTVVDATTNNLIAIEGWTNKLFSINLDTFNRKIISDFSYKNESTKQYISSSDLRLDEESGRLYLADDRRQSLLIIDKETGEKVILVKSKNNF